MSISRCRPRVILVAGEAGLEQARDDEADDGGAGKRDARAVADEVARVLDQLVGILFGDGVGDILDRAGCAARIIAIFGARAAPRSRRGVADHLGDVGKRFGRALETLGDEAARLVAGLAGELLAAAAEAVGKAALGVAAPVRSRIAAGAGIFSQ